MTKAHTFHIPVMGIGYTVDSPIKVAQYGIDSVISLVDDILLEKLRKMYCSKFEMPYNEISDKIEDFRAKRITSYLNLVNEITEKKFDKLRNAAIEKGNEIKEYLSLLPDGSKIKQEFNKLTANNINLVEVGNWVKNNLSIGSIDVNIMTKIDKDNYANGEKLPMEHNDAHAALRGFANSDLRSSLVLSAGMSPRLYGYIENFEDFYPNEKGEIKKKIILKVSDYRSALIQGRFFAKKGLWVSEYRIESGLNCGGHAFATEGFLLGPILNEFKENRDKLCRLANEVIMPALASKNRAIPKEKLQFKITAQGGVGTAEEHEFLMDHYHMDSVGWGSPFLLVPEATTLDKGTLNQLIEAKEKDLYLSDISPLGVKFNSLRGNTKDVEKLALVDKNKAGSSCPKKYLVSNKEFTDKAICTASRQYQHLKIKELDTLGLSDNDYKSTFDKIVDKSCICVGLGTSALLINDLDTSKEGEGVSVCPGPNLAYYSKEISLAKMVDHIYGRTNIISRTDRPNMFVKELNIYVEYLKTLVDDAKSALEKNQGKKLQKFSDNLKEGISYYSSLFGELKDKFEDTRSNILNDLKNSTKELNLLNTEIEKL